MISFTPFSPSASEAMSHPGLQGFVCCSHLFFSFTLFSSWTFLQLLLPRYRLQIAFSTFSASSNLSPPRLIFSIATLWSYPLLLKLHCRPLSLAFNDLHNRILMRQRGRLVQWKVLDLQMRIDTGSNPHFPTF